MQPMTPLSETCDGTTFLDVGVASSNYMVHAVAGVALLVWSLWTQVRACRCSGVVCPASPRPSPPWIGPPGPRTGSPAG